MIKFSVFPLVTLYLAQAPGRLPLDFGFYESFVGWMELHLKQDSSRGQLKMQLTTACKQGIPIEERYL